ncbi:MAG: ABC transporter substrate-binding protein [Acidobacteriaceae bacterium]
MQTVLKGITWNHTRGLLPMQATAQRFSELHPEVDIQWEKRSLQAFADAPLSQLAARFDLMVIDHPSIGEAAEDGLVLSLDQMLPEAFLRDQEQNSVGQSHASYRFHGRSWALAIDAATPVSGWRPELMERHGVAPPASWRELLELARRGLVTMPAIPIDSLMHFFMLCNALGQEPFADPESVVGEEAGVKALCMLRELVLLCAPGSLDRNPIRTWQLLTESDSVAYCPFAYGYSNYSRQGYAQHILQTGGLVALEDGTPLRSTLGGAGLAISAHCAQPDVAAQYAEFAASSACQRTLYFQSGGQPGHRAAWLDAEVNRASNNFFASTLPTLDAAWVRPRFSGFIPFQDAASNIVHRYLLAGGDERETLHAMNTALHQFRKEGKA